MLPSARILGSFECMATNEQGAGGRREPRPPADGTAQSRLIVNVDVVFLMSW